MLPVRRQMLDIFQAALAAVNGRMRVRDYLRAHVPTGPVYLIAMGKAAAAMARGAHDALGADIRAALVVTKHGYAETLPWPVLEAGHPLPDRASLDAGEKLVRFIEAVPQDGKVLVLLSGGASALVEHLPEGLSLADLQALNAWLLASGRDIAACNRVRKRLSLIKGGRLAARLAPRAVWCLAISDVPDDDPRFIGSGPLVADPTVANEPVTDAPASVRAALAHAPPLPAPDDPCFRGVRFEILARVEDAKQAAAQAARGYGLAPHIHTGFIAGPAADAGVALARTLLASDPAVLHVWGGETTVTLPAAPGRGGRSQTLALAAAQELRGRSDAWLLAAGTDGTDGPTPDAGALVDGNTVGRGEIEGLSAQAALRSADAGRFLEASGDLIHTGPTGTNVMDLMLGLKR